MVFEPLVEVVTWFRSLVPTSFKPGEARLNFITVHYIYMVGVTVLGSILLYPAGGMPYVDAFFFAGGAATQSGLNTINLNDLVLYQQIVLMLVACIANPIFINTVVVFVRLYWFEKRFERLVKEIRSQRRSRSRSFSRTRSQGKEPDFDEVENGIAGKEIRVLHETTKPNGMTSSKAQNTEAEQQSTEKLSLGQLQSLEALNPDGNESNYGRPNDAVLKKDATAPSPQTNDSPQTPASLPHLGLHPRLHRDITFADEVNTPAPASEQNATPFSINPGPEHPDLVKHIEFLERQHRNAQRHEGTLRIPGPRDFDRGEMPKELDERKEDELRRPPTGSTSQPAQSEMERARRYSDGRSEELNADDHIRRGITIDEPDHPGHQGRSSMQQDSGEASGLSRLTSKLRHMRSNPRSLRLRDRKASISRTFSSIRTARSKDKLEDAMPYLSWEATVGRNSAFLGLTQAQREELGGIEYRSLKTLAKILIVYYAGFHAIGMAVLLPWILHVDYWKPYVQSVGVDAGWWGVFTPASMFTDLGFTLTPDSMNSFETAVLPLLFGSFLIIIGNTGFPCFLRLLIWISSKLVPYGSGVWEELKFLLDHPRRCFTLLFPSKATWWLFWVLVLLNGIDLIFFIILDLNDPTVTSIPPGYRVLSGWFQAVSTRTAGFSCVNLANLHPGIQVSYMIMMYISVFPIAISVRRTNVYEEKSLGIWGGEEENGEDNPNYVGQHLRRQLSFDLWYIFLGWFIICIVEGDRLQDTTEYAFSMFSVLFEIVSAYGTVGLSLGYPNVDTSFSAQFRVISKLVIVAMMIRGRHRGLPYALDRAILLPSENQYKKEAEDADRRYARRASVLDQSAPWQEGELDEWGLPMQHAIARDDGGNNDPRAEIKLRRRSSAATTASGDRRRRRTRERSIGTIVAGDPCAESTSDGHA